MGNMVRAFCYWAIGFQFSVHWPRVPLVIQRDAWLPIDETTSRRPQLLACPLGFEYPSIKRFLAEAGDTTLAQTARKG
jgi:hypothetical protein